MKILTHVILKTAHKIKLIKEEYKFVTILDTLSHFLISQKWRWYGRGLRHEGCAEGGRSQLLQGQGFVINFGYPVYGDCNAIY